MKPFRYERAQDAASAVALVSQAAHAGYLAGGTNLVDHLKLGVSQPDVLVDITQLPYDRIEALPDGGVRIGALVRNSDLAADLLIREKFPFLAQALLAGASGQNSQSGDDGRKSLTADTLRLLSGCHQALQ